jgi:hypothetical protein
MGHHSIRVTVDVYGHLFPGGNKAAVDKLDDRTTEKIEEKQEPSNDDPQPIRNQRRAS